MTIELTDGDVLELRLLKRNLDDELLGVRTAENKLNQSRRRTTDQERELEHGTDVVGRILRQVKS